jgi:hypothetical protein
MRLYNYIQQEHVHTLGPNRQVGKVCTRIHVCRACGRLCYLCVQLYGAKRYVPTFRPASGRDVG